MAVSGRSLQHLMKSSWDRSWSCKTCLSAGCS